MSKNLVIVESPAKAKTISKFLGKDYSVLASMGHVRDLPKSKMGIDVEHSFDPSYLIPVDKKKVITELKSKIKTGTVIWLATDHDREGEAIAWHLIEALKVQKHPLHRILFHEITRPAIEAAIKAPQQLNMDLVNAQQARRILDRLVGYELSPLLWKKVRYGLSAGRVQSVAVRLVVDRERERRAFKSEEYWSIEAQFYPKGEAKSLFKAKLFKKDGKSIDLTNEAQVQAIVRHLDAADFVVSNVEQKEVRKNPAPPFITSTLQQEAARKLRFSVKKTMMLAQQLYEGIQMDHGHHGLITYMRTDSVFLSDLATTAMTKFVRDHFGNEYALDTPRRYKSKKGAQEAHEAIRPVEVMLIPEAVAKYLDKDQARLYELIWKRAVASQMAAAVFDRMAVDIDASKEGYQFRATGQRMAFPGFIKVYVEDSDERTEEDDNDDRLLPELKKDQVVISKEFTPAQHFTQPPPRYTEASLVKKLEAEGIGRPSTYAPTISTVITRGYIQKEEGALAPTDLAEIVTDVLVEHFPNIVDVGFTAKMEGDLDLIAEGEEDWVKFLKEFYGPFHENVEAKTESIKKEDVVNEVTDEICETCGKSMVIKFGRFGKFLSCSDYPQCKTSRPLDQKPEEAAALKELQRKFSDKKCSECGELMEVKRGKYGEFLGCSAYPKCKNIQAIVKFSGVKCPECKDGQLIERRTKKGGRLFWGCNKYPKCKFATWDKPVEGACETCGGLKVEKKDAVVCVTCDKK